MTGMGLVTLCFCVILASSAADPAEKTKALTVRAGDWIDESFRFKTFPVTASIISLYVDREKLDGKPVLITGILSVGDDDDGIYMSRDTYEYEQKSYSVRLLWSGEKRSASARFRGQLVFVQGIFHADEDRDGSVGNLSDIRRLGRVAREPTRRVHTESSAK